MRRARSAIGRAAALLVAALLAAGIVLAAGAWLGCASGPAPRDHYYRIEAGAPQPLGKPALPGTVEVDRFRVEAISQGRQMLYRDADSPEEIGQHAYHHWANAPNLMLQEELVLYLRAAGAADRVVTPAVKVASDYRVTGRLIRFERLLGSGAARVVIEVEVVLMRNTGSEIVLLATYREERTAADSRVAASVTAYNDALTAIYARFLADLPRG